MKSTDDNKPLTIPESTVHEPYLYPEPITRLYHNPDTNQMEQENCIVEYYCKIVASLMKSLNKLIEVLILRFDLHLPKEDTRTTFKGIIREFKTRIRTYIARLSEKHKIKPYVHLNVISESKNGRCHFHCLLFIDSYLFPNIHDVYTKIIEPAWFSTINCIRKGLVHYCSRERINGIRITKNEIESLRQAMNKNRNEIIPSYTRLQKRTMCKISGIIYHMKYLTKDRTKERIEKSGRIFYGSKTDDLTEESFNYIPGINPSTFDRRGLEGQCHSVYF